MELEITPLEINDAIELLTWRYPPPYERYALNGDPQALVDLQQFFAIKENNQLIAFRSFGSDGQVPGFQYDDSALDTGGGLRPDLTGQGRGHSIIEAGLQFGQDLFNPAAFRMTIASDNLRALSVVSKLGFHQIAQFRATHDQRQYSVLVRIG